MMAMQLQAISRVKPGSQPLHAVGLPKPKPRGREVLLRVLACGVGHTELAEGRPGALVLPPSRN